MQDLLERLSHAEDLTNKLIGASLTSQGKKQS